jgi:hypothetical protein
MSKHTPEITRFESKIYYGLDGCWYWLGADNPEGYGGLYLNGRKIGAHRAAFILYKGYIPKGMYVLHSCDNPRCVNPDHLRLGTAHDNNMDQVERNRTTYGEKARSVKLTPMQVQVVRECAAAGYSQASIARYFKLSYGATNQIVQRKTWKRVQN